MNTNIPNKILVDTSAREKIEVHNIKAEFFTWVHEWFSITISTNIC